MARSPGVRARLLLVVVVALAPVVMLLVVQASAARRDEANRVRQDSLRIARILADRQEDQADELSRLLRTVVRTTERYGVRLICDALPAVVGTQGAVDDIDVVSRDDGRGCGDPPPAEVAPGGQARLHVHGTRPAIAVVAGGDTVVVTGTSWLTLEEALAESTLPPGSTITMFGGRRVFARAPDVGGFVGTVAPRAPLLAALQRHRDDGTFEAPGLDGQRRLYGHAVVRGAQPALDLVVGMPTTIAYQRADRELRQGLVVVAATTAAAVGITLLLADATVGRPLRRIAGAARCMSAGELALRTGYRGGDEIGDVGAALDDLAASVEARNDQLARAGREREALLRELLAVQQDERRRLAEEIHDGSIQALTAAGLRVQRLRRQASDDEAVAGAARDAEEAVGRAISDLRGLMVALVPEEEEAPVAEQLRHVLQAALDAEGVAWDLQVDLASEPPQEVRSLVVRNVREAVRNAAHHAGASRVAVRVRGTAGMVDVEVGDDGVGFDPTAPVADGHIGLRATRQRTERVGGYWRLESRPGSGTSVAFGVPTD